MNYEELWEAFYEDGKYTMWFPSESIVKFFGRIAKEKTIIGAIGLDFGCGVGRNTYLMNELGLIAYGIDISKEAIKKGRKHFLGITLRIYNGKKIPFNDNHFDFIISHGVLDHMLFDKAKELMNEIYRVLKPNGLLFLELHSVNDSRCGKGKAIDRLTFIIEDECEKGLPQHYFDSIDLFELVKRFKIKKILLNEENEYRTLKNTSFWNIYLEKRK